MSAGTNPHSTASWLSREVLDRLARVPLEKQSLFEKMLSLSLDVAGVEALRPKKRRAEAPATMGVLHRRKLPAGWRPA